MDTKFKKVVNVYQHASHHWVGDGFHVRNFFPSHDLDHEINPFLLLDYAGPTQFDASQRPHGVGEHPHRGFETVTIVYQGKVAHRDSAGNQGVIGPGDVQWMTAASGVVHEEMHEASFAQQGGILEMIQLWVNLPKIHKMSKPKYQTLLKADIPVVSLGDHSYLRVIAGEFQGKHGPAQTFTSINVYDVHLASGGELTLSLPRESNTGIFVLHGEAVFNGNTSAHEANFVLFESEGETIKVKANADTKLLVLNGDPIKEPVARYGPFVMNEDWELRQAYEDYRSGKMGHLLP